MAIGQYGSFRSGVDYLANDTKRLAECIISETLFLSQSRHDNTVRVEARTGVVGSLKSIIDRLELTRYELSTVELSVSNKRLLTASEEIERLLANLKDPKDVVYVSDELCALVRELFPAKPPPDPKKSMLPEAVAIYQQYREKLINLTKEIGDGKRSPASTKKKKTRKAP